MNIAFILGITALCALTALLVSGFKKLEKPAGARS